MEADCDQDTLLITVNPAGPACHLYTASCFTEDEEPGFGVFSRLENIIQNRRRDRPENSYTTALFNKGIKRIAQKVGEEGLELALAAVSDTRDEVINEAADLIYHLLVLLRAREVDLMDVMSVLQKREKNSST